MNNVDFIKRLTEELSKQLTPDTFANKVEKFNERLSNIEDALNPDPMRAYYRLFFDCLGLLQKELKDSSLIVPVESDFYAHKHVMSVKSHEHIKHQRTQTLIKIMWQIHDQAVDFINSTDDSDKPTVSELRTIKPPQIIQDFHEGTLVSINVSGSKSVRKISNKSYTSIIQTVNEKLEKGKDLLKQQRPDLIESFVTFNNQAKRKLKKLLSVDPDSLLIDCFRLIYDTKSYRLRYFNAAEQDVYHNICNGLILLDPPVKPEIKRNSRKTRSDKKENICIPIYQAAHDGSYITEIGLCFCLTDALKFIANNQLNIDITKLKVALNG